MRRKVINLAKNTHVTTLPSSWCERFGVKKGDELDVSENGASVVVSIPDHQLKGTISVKGMHPMTKRILGAYYKAGYDTLKIAYGTDEERRVVEEVIKEEFIGLEATEIDKEEKIITAKTVSSITFDEFGSMLRRMMRIGIDMGSEIIENYLDKTHCKAIALMDKDINRYADYCRRAINQNALVNLKKEFRRNPPLYFIIEQFEKICDEIRDYALLEQRDEIDMFSQAVEYVSSFYDLFYAFDLMKMQRFGELRYRLRDEIDTKMEQGASRELSICRNIVEKTFDMNGALMALFV